MDLSKLSTADLQALQAGDLSKVSTAGLQALHQQAMSAPTQYDPSEGGSTLNFAGLDTGIPIPQAATRFLAGAGKGLTDLARGAGERLGFVSPDDVAEARRLEAPLMATTAGKVGNFVGQAVPVAAASTLVPGAGTLMGSAGVGAAQGALQPTTADESVLKNTLMGAAGGAAGYGVGKAVQAGGVLLKSKLARAAAAAAPRDAAVQAAQDAGYVLPPMQIAPTAQNALVQMAAGPVKVTQLAAQKNQQVTNDLARAAVGLGPTDELSVDALNAIRQQAGAAYSKVGASGQITPTAAYDAALDSIGAPYKVAASGFPNAGQNPIIDLVEGLRTPGFDATAALAKIGELRDAADKAFVGGDKATGKAIKNAADAIEDEVGTHLENTGQTNALADFQNARMQIAKTYDVQKALSGGNVNAAVLAKIAAKNPGRLTNELATIADSATSFPKAMAMPREAVSPYSAVDGFGGLTGAVASVHNPLALLPTAGFAVRPAVRAAALSDLGQYLATLQPGAATGNVLSDAAMSQYVPLIASQAGTQAALPKR